jgi:hypothetical protein
MKFNREVPIPKYEIGTVVCVGDYPESIGQKIGEITAIRIGYMDKESRAGVEYYVLGFWFSEVLIRYTLGKIEE